MYTNRSRKGTGAQKIHVYRIQEFRRYKSKRYKGSRVHDNMF